MKLTSFKALRNVSLVILILVLSLIVLFSQSNDQMFASSQNHDTVSDVLVDFSTMADVVDGYSDDEPRRSLDVESLRVFGDPCRKEIIDTPYKYNTRIFNVGKECYLRVFEQEKLPFEMIWRDMQYSNWKGVIWFQNSQYRLSDYTDVRSVIKEKGSIIDMRQNYPKIRLKEDTTYIKIQSHFPYYDRPYIMEISPKFPIMEFDTEGNPVNRARQMTESGEFVEGNKAGVIDNVSQIKDIELDMISYVGGNKVYIVLSNEKGDMVKYFMGHTEPIFSRDEPADTVYEVINSTQFLQPMKWCNSNYQKEPVNYIINPLPTAPNELAYFKFHSVIIEPSANNMGQMMSFLIKDIRVIYDLQHPEEQISADIQSDRLNYWGNMTELGLKKRYVYDRYAQRIIDSDLYDCYHSTYRKTDCVYSIK